MQFPGLRPEAQVYSFEKLSHSQQEAFASIVGLMKSAVDKLNSANQKFTGCDKSKQRGFRPKKDNVNRMAFLSGGRGSGKTSLIYSLMNSREGEKTNSGGDTKMDYKLRKALGCLTPQIIWLRPIEMDSLPTPDYMMASILARVNEALNWFDEQVALKGEGAPPYPPMFYSGGDHSENARERFRRFEKNAVKAWHGNLAQHAARMDPDSYISDVLDTERARLKTMEEFSNVLRGLTEHHFSPCSDKKYLFVLPLDDFDLNPRISVKLIKLIRLISEPQLFTLVAGDIEVAEDVFNLDARDQLLHINERTNDPVDWGSSSAHSIVGRMAHESSSSAMRKLFPKSHTVKLDPMDWDEVFQFSQDRAMDSSQECEESSTKGEATEEPDDDSGKEKTIGEMLGAIPFEINTIPGGDRGDDGKQRDQYVAGYNVKSLKAFFDIEVRGLVFDERKALKATSPASLTLEKRTREDMVYTGPVLFKMNHRHAHDMWRMLDGYVQKKKEKENEKGTQNSDSKKFWVACVREIARELFLQSANDGEFFSKELCDTVMGAIQEDCYGKLQLDTHCLEIDQITGPRIHFSNPSTPGQVVVTQPKSWRVSATVEACPFNPSPHTVTLSSRAKAALMFLHDHLVLAEPSGIVGRSLMKKLDPPDWAHGLWPGGNGTGVKVPWPLPPLRSLWAHDLFSRCWAQVWEWMEEKETKYAIEDLISKGKEPFNLYLKYLWVKIGCGIFSGKEKKAELVPLASLTLYHLRQGNHTKESLIDYLKCERGASWKVLFANVEEGCRKKILSGYYKELEKQNNFCSEQTGGGNSRTEDGEYLELVKFIKTHVLVFLPDVAGRLRNTNESETAKDIEEVWKKHFAPKNLMNEILDEINELLCVDKEKKSRQEDGCPCGYIHGRRETLIRSWLAGIVCLMAPESGGKKEEWEAFLDKLNSVGDVGNRGNGNGSSGCLDEAPHIIKEILLEPDMVAEVRARRAKTAARFFDQGLFGELRFIYKPIRRSFASSIATHRERLVDRDFSPFYEDIVRASSLPDLERKAQARKLDVFLRIKGGGECSPSL
ncbi:hypothetical protein [Desulfoluna butyratoxydans]|uniref:Uncharacterized protein n=1 Tax=Desulfoluna butyratoxydans TaxID=231438 RepID=A0A4V6ILV0_9BACT|nr:hypothetical protein [Desulfoluna butyratoxydans]VFQ46448.1 hypothetical protein MSL71_41120 [Desulfoluna butyratoxydans]